jgi:hypothetical protein
MNKTFPDPIQLEPLADGRRWRVLAAFRYQSRGREVVVPAGFVTDMASVPRALWWLMPPWDRYGPAAIVHDLDYRQQWVSRAEADALFLAGMAALKVPGPRRWVIYLALRLFGGFAWRANARKRSRQS